MEALHDVVKAGKARYLGASSMCGVAVRQGAARGRASTAGRASCRCRTTTTCSTAKRSGRWRPLCRDQGVGMIPWSPLARGRLARAPGARRRPRTETDGFGKRLYASTEEADARVQAALDDVAKARKLPHAQVALAWLLQKERRDGAHRRRDEDGAPRGRRRRRSR